MRPWSILSDGALLAVRLTPKGGRDAVEGIERLADGSVVLRARVRATPHEGAANAALQKLIAIAVGVPPGRVTLVRGARARMKTLKIAGDGRQLAAGLEALVHTGEETADAD
jgi:uncharacterized protein